MVDAAYIHTGAIIDEQVGDGDRCRLVERLLPVASARVHEGWIRGEHALGLTPSTTFDFSVVAGDNYFTGALTDAIENMTLTLGTPKYVGSGIPAAGVPLGGGSTPAPPGRAWRRCGVACEVTREPAEILGAPLEK